MSRRSLFALALVAVLSLCASVVPASAAVISAIYPRTGSLLGGQMLTITGSGFSREGTMGSTMAYIGNNQCKHIEYYSSDTQYVCVTPPAPGGLEGAYSVQIATDGIAMYTTGFATCLLSVCQFQYLDKYTSKLRGFPAAAGAGAVLPFQGSFIDASLFAQWQVRVGDNAGTGSAFCDLDYAGHPEWAAAYGNNSAVVSRGYLTDLNVEPMYVNEFKCYMLERTAGRTNYSITILPPNNPSDQIWLDQHGGGYTTVPHAAYRTSLDGKDEVYNFETFPVVQRLSAVQGGMHGGSVLTIQGSGFDAECTETSVKLAGNPCKILSCTSEQITCVPSAAETVPTPTPAPSAYSGSRGLLTEVWYPESWWQTLPVMFNSIGAPAVTLVQASSMTAPWHWVEKTFMSRQTGLFTPPYSANYTFYIQGQDKADLWLSRDDDAAGLESIASFTGSPGLYYPQANMVSASRFLEAGRSYAIMLRNVHAGWQDRDLSVMLRMDRSTLNDSSQLPAGYPSTNVLTYHSLPTVMQVAVRTDVRREVQLLSFAGVGSGTFRVQYANKITEPLFFGNVTAARLDDALTATLKEAGVCSSITVEISRRAAETRTNMTVKFDCAGAVPRNLLNIVNDGLKADSSAGLTFAFQVSRLSLPSAPASGRFVLAWSPNPDAVLDTPSPNLDRLYTNAINYDANALRMQQSLLTISGVRDVEVTNSGNTLDGQTFKVTFYTPYGKIPLLQAVTNGTLFGENARVEISYLQVGDAENHYWDPLPAEFLTTAAPASRVEMAVRGIKAVCGAGSAETESYATNGGNPAVDCTYAYTQDLTPTITAVTTTGNFAAGATLTITGTNLESDAGATLVSFARDAAVLAFDFASLPSCTNVVVASSTQLTCTVPELEAASYVVQVNVAGLGLNEPHTLPALQFALRIDSIMPARGSVAGGSLLALSGSGFQKSLTGANVDVITVNSAECALVDASPTLVLCRTPALDVSDAYPTDAKDISVNGQVQTETFTYDATLTPVIDSVSPSLVSSAVTNLITISGSGFVADMANAPAVPSGQEDAPAYATYSVALGDRTCDIVSNNATVVVCRLARAAPPNLHQNTNARLPLLYVAGLGYASNPNDLSVDIALRVHSLSVSHGSLAGGSLITITGAGFRPQPKLVTDHSVSIDPEYISVRLTLRSNVTGLDADKTSFPCQVLSYDMFNVVCRTTDTNVTADQLGGADGSMTAGLLVSINNVASVCGGASDDECSFEFRAADTPFIAAITPTSDVAGSTLTISGVDLDGANATVYIGHEECPITSQSATEIECTVPAFTTSTMPVYVEFAGVGFAAAPQGLLRFTTQLAITSIDVVSGGVGGGSVVVASGSGFSPRAVDNVLSINGAPAFVLSATTSSLTFLTPSTPRAAVVAAGGVLNAPVVVATRTYFALEDFFSADIVLDNIGLGVYRLQSTPNATLDDSFAYSVALTPSLIAVTPLTGQAGTTLTITGTAFGDSAAAVNVMIGGAECVVSTFTNRSIECALGSTPAGRHAVLVTVGSVGYAATATGAHILFNSELVLSSVQPLQGGYGGGTLLTIQGSGFGDATQSAVKVGNADCLVQSASYSQLTCVTTPIVTLDRLRAFGATLVFPATGVAYGSNTLSTTVNTYASAFDGNVETGFVGRSSGQSAVRLDTGSQTNLVLTRIRFYPAYQQAATLNGAQFFASDNGQDWTLLATASGVLESWNSIDMLDTNTPAPDVTRSWRYFGMVGYSGLKVMEVEFQGFRVAALPGFNAVSVPPVDAAPCSVQLQVTAKPARNPAGADFASPLQNATSKFSYSIASTPTVIAVAPVYASALGGELVTLTGTGFVASNPGAHEVELNGYPCAVQSVDAAGTEIVCLTGPRVVARPAPSGREISVRVTPAAGSPANTPSGYALLVPNPDSNVSPLANQALPPVFRYLDRWSALTTWRFQEPPVEGDTVVIPQGQAVLLDVSPPRLFFLLIQGVLIFDERDLALNATYIYVQGGKLEIGTETKPFTHRAVITLHGDRWKDVELPHYGVKALINGPISHSMMDGVGAVPHNPMAQFGPGVIPSALPAYYSDNWDGRGRLDLHGIPRVRTWTKVASSVAAGGSTIVTSEDVDFAPGEEVVITSHQTWQQTERRFVQSLGADKRTLTFTAPLTYAHRSEQWDFDGHHVDMRYEVGLLTRNIVVQGDDASESQMFGGHIMSLQGGIMRVENIEIRRNGQSHNLGRYSIHFHLAGAVADSYIRSNSIHDSFQRAVTVHGSHYARVQNNVAAFVRGHTYFVEDGNEKYNVLEGNLGVHTTRLASMLKSDTKPATFWTSSPENFWRHNVAAGCINDGFWLELPGNPGGPSYSPKICPVHAPLGEFFNNTAHSNGVHGLRIYPVYLPLRDPCNPHSGPSPQTFENFTSFHNGDNGIFGKHNGDLHHRNHKLVENGNSDLAWEKLEEVDFPSSAIPHVQNCLFVATPSPAARPFRNSRGRKVGLWSPQNEYFHIAGATFVNYGDNGAIAGCHECLADDSLSQGGFTIRTSGLKFIDSHKRVLHTAPFKEIWMDMDGSLTGHVNASVTFRRAFNEWAECHVDETGELDGGIWCESSVRIRRVQFDGVLPKEMDFLFMTYTQSNGLGQISPIPAGQAPGTAGIAFLPKKTYGWVAPMVTGHFYSTTWLTRMDWRTIKIRYSEPDYVRSLAVPGTEETEFIGLQFNYTDYRYNFAVVSSDNRLRPWKETPLDASIDHTGVGFMGNLANQNGTWNVLVSSRNSSLYDTSIADPLVLNVRALQCPLDGCPVPPPPQLGNMTRWSNPASWPGGVLPAPGSPVLISNTMNILYDLTGTQTFGRIDVEGALTFEDGAAQTLNAPSIVVFGSLTAGTPAEPRKSKLTLSLSGSRTSPTVVVSNSHFLGNKVFAVFGEMRLHGATPLVTSTKLATTLAKGASQLTLLRSVDWAVGDEIVVSSTEYDSSQAETFKIVSITGSTLSLDHPAVYTHFGATIDTSAATNPTGAPQSVHLAAAVGLLTRPITLTSELTEDEARYGSHLVVGEITSEPAGSASLKVGSLSAHGVDFRQMGQGEMEHAAVMFAYFPQQAGSAFVANPKLQLNTISACAFSFNFNYGIEAAGAPNVRVVDTVVYQSRRSALFFDDASPGATITGNLIVDVRRSLDDTAQWLNPFAAIYVDAPVAALSGNTVGGSEDAGIVFHPEACGSSAAVVHSNDVHAARIGVWLLSNAKWGCVRSGGFTAWKAAHVAVLTVDQTNSVELSNMVVSDSHIGVSLNFYGGYLGTKASITGSVIMGSTAASGDCAASSVCRAASATDVRGEGCNSVYGASVRRIGLMTTQYTNRGKTCRIDGIFGEGLPVCRPPTTPERLCSLPWESRFGLPNDGAHGSLHVSSTTFAYFASSDCGQRSAAVAWNPTQRDFAPPMFFQRIGWHSSVEESAKFDFKYRPGVGAEECANGCDGLDQINLSDLDGTALSRSLAPVSGSSGATSPGHTLLSRNVLLAKAGTACVEQSAWGGIVCADTRMHQLVVENMDFDRGQRKLGPLKSTRFGSTENRTDISFGPFDDHCPMRFFFGQYVTQVIPGHSYGLELAGSNAAVTRVGFRSSDPAEAVLVSFFYTQPLVLDVLVNGQLVANNDNTVTPTLDASTPAGASQFSAQARRILVLLRGNADPKQTVYSIVQKPLVQVTLALAISINEFYGPKLVNNLALLLSIDPSRIKIVSVQPGSTIVQMQVADAEPTSDLADEMSAQADRLTELSSQLSRLASTGGLTEESVGYPVIGLRVTPPSVNGTVLPEQEVTVVQGPSSASSDSFPAWAIAIIVVGVMGVVGGAVAILLVVKSRAAQAQAQRFIAESTGIHAHVHSGPIKKTAVADEDTELGRHIDVAPASPSALHATTAPAARTEMEMAPVVRAPHTDDVPTVVLQPGSMAPVSSSRLSPKRLSPLRHPNGGLLSGASLSAVHEMDSLDRGESQWKSGSPRVGGGGDTHRMGLNELPEGHYACTRSYAPKFADELELLAGDVVIVLDGSSSDWFIGFNTRTGRRGSFPKNVVTRDQRILNPIPLAAAEIDTGSGSGSSASSVHSGSRPYGSHSVSPNRGPHVHSRADSSNDIVVAQERGREGIPVFERASRAMPRVPEASSSDSDAHPGMLVLGNTRPNHMAQIKSKHSGMLPPR